jgi:hypothetical protein
MAAVEVSVVALEQSGIVPAAGGTCVDGRKEKTARRAAQNNSTEGPAMAPSSSNGPHYEIPTSVRRRSLLLQVSKTPQAY